VDPILFITSYFAVSIENRMDTVRALIGVSTMAFEIVSKNDVSSLSPQVGT
jgi:hypothetical protein